MATMIELMCTEREADDLASGRKTFTIREDKYHYQVGTIITFKVVKAMKKVKHAVDEMQFMVTYASNREPILHGYTVINLRRIA